MQVYFHFAGQCCSVFECFFFFSLLLVVIYSTNMLGSCLVAIQKLFTPSHQIFGHIHEVLNIDKIKKLITQIN